MIDKVRPRTGYDLSAFTSHSFDFRALSYVCGQVACLAATGIDNDLSRDGSAKCTSIGQIWNNPNGGDIMVPPNVIFKSGEWATLACIAKLAKCDTLTFLSDVLPPQESRQLQGKSLCVFLLRLHACILSSADGMGCAAHHDEAFFRGMCSAWTLWGHSDEGGWARNYLAKADYPRPRGLLAPTSTTMSGLPVMQNVSLSSGTRWCVALFLRGAGIWSAVDKPMQGVCTAMAGVQDADEGPAQIAGLQQLSARHLELWRRKVEEIEHYIPSPVFDEASHISFWRDNDADSRHLYHEVIFPFFWVEPSPIMDYGETTIYMPCVPLKVVEMEMFPKSKSFKKSRNYPDNCIVPPRGSATLIAVDSFEARRSGSQYILSGRYRRADGLGSLVEVPSAHFATDGNSLLFSGQSDVFSQKRWITPHNPMAHPAECRGATSTLMTFRHSSGDGHTRNAMAYPNYEDLQGNIRSVVGDFSVVAPSSGTLAVASHRDVPRALRRELLRTLSMGDYGDDVMSNQFEEVEIFPHISATSIAPPPDTEGADSSLTYASAPKDDFGPEVKVELVGSAGVVPKQPTRTLDDVASKSALLGSE
jgi:hypothetical protein